MVPGIPVLPDILLFSWFYPLFSQFGSQSHPYFFNYPPGYLNPPHTPRPWRPQLRSSNPESDRLHPLARLCTVTPGDWGACEFGDLSCWVLPRSDKPIMPLQHSRPNSALGRGGIQNHVPRCVVLANLRPLRHRGSPLPDILHWCRSNSIMRLHKSLQHRILFFYWKKELNWKLIQFKFNLQSYCCSVQFFYLLT